MCEDSSDETQYLINVLGFAITAVQNESYAQFRAVLAAELKIIRTPTRITGFHRNTAFVPTGNAGLFESTLNQQIVIMHDPVNLLHVDHGQQLGVTGATQ